MKHILLTGKPRTGKTTLLKRIIKDLDNCGGFFTEEIIKNNQRRGFRIRTLEGKQGILASKDLKSRFKLGKYRINIKDLEEIGVKAVEEALETKDTIVIDEIGKMELFSKKFKDIVKRVLDSGKRLIGVIHPALARKGGVHIADLEFLNKIRVRKDVVILEVNLENHDHIFQEVKALLKS